MRKEFFRWWSITIMVLGVPIGIFMTGAGVWRFLGDVRLSARVFIVVWTACAASWTIFVTATPWLRKRSKTRPLLIIDDTGLWLRTVGELMPWSEIQSVDWWILEGAAYKLSSSGGTSDIPATGVSSWIMTESIGGHIPSTKR